ncbi:MAG: protein-export rane protein SecF [Frankiales bacterium]|nr:protein-export rane protein SecF [Frankiales bacterium]
MTEQPHVVRHGIVHRLYHGETTFPLIRARRKFYAVALVMVVVALGSMLFRGFNLGVEFKGGAIFQVPLTTSSVSVADTRTYVQSLGVKDPIVQTLKSSNGNLQLRVESEPLTDAEKNKVQDGLATHFKVNANDITSQNVGASWGKQVTTKALQGLVVFLLAVVLYISVRFEPKMAASAIIALLHDLLLAAGIYSVTQFVVTPSTVIALLTVLGYSLYDTIVVFDKVEENTRGLEKQGTLTYSEAAELAVNQTFMRSINTSLIALLPVSGLLFVGALLLGAGTLRDLALALFVGLASGAYSSLFLATPLLADLKEREPRFKTLHQRVLDRRASGKAPVRLSQRSAYAAAVTADADADAPEAEAAPGKVTTTATRRPTQQRKKAGRPGRPSGKRKR